MIRRGFNVPAVDRRRHVRSAARRCLQFGHSARRQRASVAGHYDKVRLLAFGEYIPGIETFPWLRKFLPPGHRPIHRRQRPGVMTLQEPGGRDLALGPVICYEDILQGFLRGVGQLHPNLLVNLTSDSWFGADTEPWEHLALAVFASVELRVSMVRAVNSGVSALIDPNGRVAAENLRRRSLSPSASRGRHAGRGAVDGGRPHGVRRRGQSVRLPLRGGNADSIGRGAQGQTSRW